MNYDYFYITLMFAAISLGGIAIWFLWDFIKVERKYYNDNLKQVKESEPLTPKKRYGGKRP